MIYVTILLITLLVFAWRKIIKRTPEDGAKRQEVFPPEWIPGPIRLPVIGSAYKYLPGAEYSIYQMTKSCMKMYKKYGPIVREKLGDNCVQLFNAKDVKELVKKEGRYPKRTPLKYLTKVAEDMNTPVHLSAEQGEDWYRQRRVLEKYAMNSDSVALYLPEMEEVTACLD